MTAPKDPRRSTAQRPPSSSRTKATSDVSFAIDDGRIAPPPPKRVSELDEVEHALSTLEGRHPDYVRAEREKAEAMARRRSELEAAERRARDQGRRRLLVGSIIVTVLGVAGWGARTFYESRREKLAASDALLRSFAPLGFQEVPVSLVADLERMDVPVQAGTCVIALGASGGKPIPIEVTHDGDTLEAQGSIGLCTCNDETIKLVAKGGEPGKRSVRFLRTDARAFGSVLGFERAATKPATVVACACVEDHLDAWLRTSARDGLREPDTKWSKALEPELTRVGMTHVATSAPNTTLVPLEIAADSCVVAVAAEPATKLALRAPGGSRVVAAEAAPLAVCSKTPRVFAAWQEGNGSVHVLKTEAARVGGRHELTKSLATTSLGTPRVWVDASDLGWDAELALRALRAAPVDSMEWAPKTKLPDSARMFVFSIEGAAAKDAPATSTGDAACERSTPSAPTLFCVTTMRQPWGEVSEKVHGAVAHAPLAPWLKPLADLRGAEPARVALALGVLGRKLVTKGFEPTPLDGITETAAGADVLGRAGEDSIVAVTVQPVPPYALPLSDGAAWSLDGAPRIIDLAPGRRISLRSRPAPSGDVDQRRTIVFRHAARKP